MFFIAFIIGSLIGVLFGFLNFFFVIPLIEKRKRNSYDVNSALKDKEQK